MLDEQLDVLSDATRRRLLFALIQDEGRHDTSLSARKLAQNGQEAPPLLLRHVHLPKLEDYGYIDWERETNRVQRGPQFDEIRPLLTLLEDNREELVGTDTS